MKNNKGFKLIEARLIVIDGEVDSRWCCGGPSDESDSLHRPRGFSTRS
ncbi:hypothetical protein M6B38_168915 [Iris pallida]|uniref:Uncharacterized protein n=1 Tax=Iris pallida TaxID=29817 RepID=A0AAX6EVZ0_IRIPA|nr:hypothetical protein M6B38_168915 [Iris pallida]